MEKPMSASAISQDSRFRTLAVLLPACGLLIYVASELASEEYIAPVLIIGGFLGSVLVALFTKAIRLEAVFIGFLLIGYLIGNRGFADLAPVRPIFVGELGLAAALITYGIRFLLRRIPPDISGRLSKCILLFLMLGSIRFLFDVRTYGIDAARDFALVYYCLFFFLASEIGKEQASRRFIEGCLLVGFVGLAIVYIALRVAPEAVQTLRIGDLSILAQKDDLTSTFAAAGAFFFYLRDSSRALRWLWGVLIILFMALVFNGFTRASLLAMMGASVLCWIAGRKNFYIYIGLALILGLTVLSGYSVLSEGTDRSTEFTIMKEKVLSIIDFTGKAGYASDFGQTKADDNEFRRVFWQSVFDDTNEQHPLVGLGFGYDLTARFLQTSFGRGEESGTVGLRSPHSYYVTVYGRMGIIGFLVLLAITAGIIRGGINAALKVRAGKMDKKNLFYWCAAWVILISAAFGVVLEGPMGAIIFWSLLGLAASSPTENDEANVNFKRGVTKRLAPAVITSNRPLAFAGSR